MKHEKRQKNKQRIYRYLFYKEIGHKFSRSSQCKHYSLFIQRYFSKTWGKVTKHSSEKVPFNDCVKLRYWNSLKSRINSVCKDTRQIVFKAQLFVNY